jgi:hypothetical protein
MHTVAPTPLSARGYREAPEVRAERQRTRNRMSLLQAAGALLPEFCFLLTPRPKQGFCPKQKRMMHHIVLRYNDGSFTMDYQAEFQPGVPEVTQLEWALEGMARRLEGHNVYLNLPRADC